MWYGISLTIGLLMLGSGLFLLRKRVQLIRNGIVTTGTVDKILKEANDDGGYHYIPVFKFTTPANKEVKIKYFISSSRTEWSVGEEVKLSYNEQFPRKAIVLTYWGSFLPIVLLTSFAMPFIVIGGGYYLAEFFFRTV